MNDVPEILTAKILAELAWKSLKEGYSLTKETLRESLKKWILTEPELQTLKNVIDTIPETDKRTKKYIEAYLDDHTIIRNIIDKAKCSNTSSVNQNHSGTGNIINQTHNGSGDNVAGNKIVG